MKIFKTISDTNQDKEAVGTQTDEMLEQLVDPILNEMDKDKDGYITYTEYRSSEIARGMDANNN